MKKFISGLIIGMIVAFSLTAYAAVELRVVENPFPILINGVITTVEAYNINGFTYFKLADLGEAGLIAKFNETQRQIEITNNLINDTSSIKGIAGDTMASDSEINSLITETPDGIREFYNWNNEQYVQLNSIQNVIKEKGYDITKIDEPIFDTKTGNYNGGSGDNKWKLIKGTYDPQKVRIDQTDNYTVLIDDVPVIEMYGGGGIEVNYYINTILPLIK